LMVSGKKKKKRSSQFMKSRLFWIYI
jgi:hypothetical protein